jgi:molybdopterin-containing oxidoreductase family membrane subunit
MNKFIGEVLYFSRGLFGVMFKGGVAFYAWMLLLTVLLVTESVLYFDQVKTGLIVTNMRDQVSWGFYIPTSPFLSALRRRRSSIVSLPVRLKL